MRYFIMMMFINYFCCMLVGVITALAIIAIFGAGVPHIVITMACAASGFLTSQVICKWFKS